jgi:hypothetical protein
MGSCRLPHVALASSRRFSLRRNFFCSSRDPRKEFRLESVPIVCFERLMSISIRTLLRLEFSLPVRQTGSHQGLPVRRSLGIGGSRASCARRSSPAVANSSGVGGPFVAWHSGRQNSTGRATSFRVIADTGLLLVAGFLLERQRQRLPTLPA